jgi:choline-glycine betaine transporter
VLLPDPGVELPYLHPDRAGRSVGVILLVLGTLCVLAAGAVFIAVAWTDLPVGIRALVLIVLTAGFGFFAQVGLGRGLQATAEALAAIACGMFVLDVAAGRRAGLPGLADLAARRTRSLPGVCSWQRPTSERCS